MSAAPPTTRPHPPEAPSAEDLEALILQTWDSYLAETSPAVPLIPAPSSPVEDDLVAWSASISFEGPWRGLVALELQGPTAELATRELLAMDADEQLTDEDVADAVGELVNIIGGSVKSSVAAAGALSLPVVAAGRVALPRTSQRLCGVTVQWHGRPVRVHLHTTAGGTEVPQHPEEDS